MKLLFLLGGKQEKFVQGRAKGTREIGWDGIDPCEDAHTPGTKGGVDLGDCDERFGRGKGIGGEKRGRVDDRNLLVLIDRHCFVGIGGEEKVGLMTGTCSFLWTKTSNSFSLVLTYNKLVD